jgi:hypothetical protein
MSQSMSHCAFNALRFHYISRSHPNAQELTNHILHPSPEPYPGLQEVAGRSRKVIAQAVGNGSCVADWKYQQFSQDTFNWNDIENWFLVLLVV